ncbi:hypothetical protein [Sessilibacter sp. MAH2]
MDNQKKTQEFISELSIGPVFNSDLNYVLTLDTENDFSFYDLSTTTAEVMWFDENIDLLETEYRLSLSDLILNKSVSAEKYGLINNLSLFDRGSLVHSSDVNMESFMNEPVHVIKHTKKITVSFLVIISDINSGQQLQSRIIDLNVDYVDYSVKAEQLGETVFIPYIFATIPNDRYLLDETFRYGRELLLSRFTNPINLAEF